MLATLANAVVSIPQRSTRFAPNANGLAVGQGLALEKQRLFQVFDEQRANDQTA